MTTAIQTPPLQNPPAVIRTRDGRELSIASLLGRGGIYGASRASIPERPAMWRQLREEGWPIISTWIDEADVGATGDFAELWARIEREIRQAAGLMLYAEASDFPLKGALIEVGIALGAGKPVAVVAPDVEIQGPDFRPLGSWIAHPRVKVFRNRGDARQWLEHQDKWTATVLAQAGGGNR
ncbi:hypothetical protein ACOTHJ_12965 [Achromobacter xylosoxidans]|uniref:hypothetical protein n=1 Tax=Achromobacter anxifer TaxID=1287737 RepID=UPI0015920F89|nr:hypothetical protein [Achromobacter anxifer]